MIIKEKNVYQAPTLEVISLKSEKILDESNVGTDNGNKPWGDITWF